MSAQQTIRLARNLSSQRAAAIIVWLIGAYTTQIAVQEMRAMSFVLASALAIAVQLIMTAMESPIWRGKFTIASAVVLGFDAAFNFGGVWFYAKNLNKTTAWLSIAEAAQLSPSMPVWVPFLVSIVVSIAIAAAPETLWKEG